MGAGFLGLQPRLVCYAPLAPYRTVVLQAGMSRERAGISGAATSPTNSRPARAPVPHEEAGTRYDNVLFLHRAFTSPAPVTPALGHRLSPFPAPQGAAGRSPGPATRNAWRSPGVSAPSLSPAPQGAAEAPLQRSHMNHEQDAHDAFKHIRPLPAFFRLETCRSHEWLGQETLPQPEGLENAP